MFRGQYRHTIDPKGRLSIPAKFRDVLNTEYGDKLVIAPVKSAEIQVHPLSRWQELEAKVSRLSPFDEDVRRFRRQFLSLGEDVTLDPQGRIQIRQDYRERAALVKDVMIVGMGEYFDVWNVERWTAAQDAPDESLDDLFSRVAQKGV